MCGESVGCESSSEQVRFYKFLVIFRQQLWVLWPLFRILPTLGVEPTQSHPSLNGGSGCGSRRRFLFGTPGDTWVKRFWKHRRPLRPQLTPYLLHRPTPCQSWWSPTSVRCQMPGHPSCGITCWPTIPRLVPCPLEGNPPSLPIPRCPVVVVVPSTGHQALPSHLN